LESSLAEAQFTSSGTRHLAKGEIQCAKSSI
jgi:hypothetical protein